MLVYRIAYTVCSFVNRTLNNKFNNNNNNNNNNNKFNNNNNRSLNKKEVFSLFQLYNMVIQGLFITIISY